ncbi:mitochondrial GTPase (YlqF), putative [Talaromyces stipitatus ATCC 10500]|uniref:Mitochondrial GTPase (YlqF), putative n=1 Tax=Talaromyces stipitatus (strain ATCC 10500 / CBS 375.48 / QM 6759 / NRRL 1006) TaxID=441959 RepID=B8MDA4_TALSN|nr:mitochondrial GTPase (YlqF), putative [Talaromyces stipitatus ATCC 10500]EED17629.1 mitochondrial GTPase (YlqF), putative [Talaromyces stipitatus ATCC 10500]
MTTKFIPRAVFPHYDSIPRSYFLGHHKAGLEKMKSMISRIDYIIECRDFRVPITSINPMFEEALGDKQRLIVYTKRDLGGEADAMARRNKELMRKLDPNTTVFFTTSSSPDSVSSILRHLKNDKSTAHRIAACRAMVVGMPNIGKSSLINTLRNQGVHKAKALKTGEHPGVTRKIGTPVKVVERQDGSSVYVLDTPGVFVPYMPDAERMLKLALCGCVKDTIIPPVTLADYLLYHINLINPEIYGRWSGPTNEIMPLLTRFSLQVGLLSKGAVPNIEQAAINFVQKWRSGDLGKFVLDDIRAELRARKEGNIETIGPSRTQQLKAITRARINRKKEQRLQAPKSTAETQVISSSERR